ncbi:MAG: iron ABC transporter permease [Anaerolineales bacterium]|nr:iron ABC transporter permease [Anaerolineales bacterium]
MTLPINREETKLRRFFPRFFASSRLNSRPFLWLFPLGFIGLFFFYPLSRILTYSLDLSVLTPENLRLTSNVLLFTLYQAFLSTLLTLAVGLPAAYLFACFDFPGKAMLRALTAVPFMLPTVVVAAGFNALLGPRGWLNLGLMNLLGLETPPIQLVGTLGAILLAHIFYNTTIVIRLVGSALSQLDPRLESAARTLGADSRRAWWYVTLPLLRPSLLAAGLLVFLFDFTSFGVILLLGGPGFATLEVEIYIQALQMLNLPLAGLLSAVQLLCTLVFSVLYTRVVARTRIKVSPRAAQYNLRRARIWREKVFVTGLGISLILVFVLPMLALPLRSVSRLEAARGQRTDVQYGLTTDYYSELFVNRRGSLFYVPPIRAALNSLGYAGLTVLFSLLMGFPAASALARPGKLERWLDPLLVLPLGASAVTLGLGFIISFNRPPLRLLASPWLVPLAHTMVALPFVIRTLQPALASIPERLRDAASSLGASPFRAWLAVDWPIIWRASLAAATFAFTVSLGEFGATALLTRPEYPTIPIAIYRFLSQPGGLNYGQAMAMASMLMVLATIGILLIERLRLPGAREF